jgi:cytidine deaminase
MTTRRSSPRPALTALLKAALRVRKNAHCPYSHFPVGAAVLAGGRIFTGVNVENSSFPHGQCAERSAIGAAVTAGFTKIEAVAVVGGTLRPVPPCGGCRQSLSEFCASETPVVYATPGGRKVATTMGELLPAAFGAADLASAPAAPRAVARMGRR